MPTIVVSAPRAQPVSRSYVKLHSRIVLADEDLLLDTWIRTATDEVQSLTWRQLVTAIFDYVGDCFPSGSLIRLPRAPLRRVESIKYLDASGVEQTFASANYRVLPGSDIEPGYVELGYGKTWPTTYPVRNAVTIRLTGGYATPFAADPTTDVLGAAGHPYADGDVLRAFSTDGDLPSPLALDRDYYARDVVAGVSLKLSEAAGGAAIDIEDGGTGLNFLGVIPLPFIHAIALQVRDYDAHREAAALGGVTPAVSSLLSGYSLQSHM